MSTIHDPIHGDIILSDLAIQIIDHPLFNRTHYIYQTGTAYRIFPSATHTRKAHMIGTYAITKKLLDHLSHTSDIDEHTMELISIGALCHDIGHGPGSHVFDKHVIPKMIEDKNIASDHPWVTHEQRSICMFRYIAKNLDLSDEDIDFICKVIDPPIDNSRWEFNIVNNTEHGIDTDKLDYITRDNYMLGLKLNIDVDQIIQKSRIINGRWSFSTELHDELFNVIFVRYRLHRILNQAKIVKFDLSYRNIMTRSELYVEVTKIFTDQDINEFAKFTDTYVLQYGAREDVDAFHTRNTYTRVACACDDDDIEGVSLNIRICKVPNDAMANMTFYDPRTYKLCDINKSLLDTALPGTENMSYAYKYKN